MNEAAKPELTVFDTNLLTGEVKKSSLLLDFLNLLAYLKEKPAKLTLTGNLSRKVIGEISKFIPIPRHYFEHGWRLNNQQDWPYLDQLVALTQVGRFTFKRKGYKGLSAKGKKYLGLLPTTQYGELFLTYWNNLNWGYLFPFGNDDPKAPANILCLEKYLVVKIMRDYEKGADSWIDFFKFAEYIRERFDLKHLNYLGVDLPERVRDCIVDVLIEPFLGFGMVEVQSELFDHHRISHTTLRAFRFTGLGDKMLEILSDDKPAFDLFGAFFNLN